MKKFFQWLATVTLFATLTTNAIADEYAPLKVIVGTQGTMQPFTYVDENNHLTGFDVEVLRAVAKTDPNLKFEFKQSGWDALFPGLDAGHIDTIANQIAATPERLKRYYLTKNHYFNDGSHIIVLKDRADKLDSIEKLRGKRVAVSVGTNHSRALENWNRDRAGANKGGDEIKMVYSEGEMALMLQDLASYRLDALVNSAFTALTHAKTSNIEIAIIGEPLYSSPIHFPTLRTERGAEIQKRIDTGLKKIRENGKLRELSLQFFGEDLTQ